MNRAIFMDRDGVINKWEHGQEDVPESWYVLSWEQFEFLPGVMDAFRQIASTDYHIIVVSNQSGIGRGFVDYNTVDQIFKNMQMRVLDESKRFLSYYFCPHAPDAGCACRKPSPGMIYKAAIEHSIDLSKSWMIGDSETDMQAGRAAQIPNLVKIRRGLDLLTAVKFIINEEAEK